MHQIALDYAVAVAREAGAVLRQEFHRPGGMRGSGGHCPADAEVEGLIRERLTLAFPDWSVRGEELESQLIDPGDAQGYTWLIDPHDGTSPAQKGMRGASVSIALLRGAVPVLGVVYAYAYPDDNGDLIAWAEGCGPLTRNGQPVSRTWPGALTGECTVLVSQDADHNPVANARAAAPARFIASPSIAYRLARVAAGDADVAVSLGGPVDHDYAAGDALLRGVGGVLLGASGKPVTYNPTHKTGSGGACFGGGSALATVLAKRDWQGVFKSSPGTGEPFALAHLHPGQAIADPGLLSRAQGCLLGQLAGDALGSLVEFESKERIASKYPQGVRRLADGGTWQTIAGQPTDDSELALLLARSLEREGKFDEEAVARAYACWYESGPFDIGTTTRQGLSAASRAKAQKLPVAPAAREAASQTSQANGALMRVSPLGIFGYDIDPNALANLARQDAALTHPHPFCQDASALFAVAIARAIAHGETPGALFEWISTWARTQTQTLYPGVLAILEDAQKGPPTDFERQQGWVRIALHNALWQLLHAGSFEVGVVDTVGQGGDTDTNSAIAGALLGAVYGRESVPRQWSTRLLSCRPIQDLAGVKRPRPRMFWPVDALVLAERLLLSGRGHGGDG